MQKSSAPNPLPRFFRVDHIYFINGPCFLEQSALGLALEERSEDFFSLTTEGILQRRRRRKWDLM
jgi:hypothetical protein